jgi:hypothetical protein
MAPLDVLLKPKECVMLLIDFQAGLGFGAESASRQVVLVPQETTDLLAPMKRFGWIIHCTSSPQPPKQHPGVRERIQVGEKRATRRGEILSLPRWAMFALLGQSRFSIRHSGLQAPTTKDEWQFEGSR